MFVSISFLEQYEISVRTVVFRKETVPSDTLTLQKSNDFKLEINKILDSKGFSCSNCLFKFFESESEIFMRVIMPTSEWVKYLLSKFAETSNRKENKSFGTFKETEKNVKISHGKIALGKIK